MYVCVVCNNNKEKEAINLRGNRGHGKGLWEAMLGGVGWRVKGKIMKGKMMFSNDVTKMTF